MAKIVNLGRARKDKARSEKRQKADANAAFHGLTKAEKTLARARRDKAARDLDGHKTKDTDGS